MQISKPKMTVSAEALAAIDNEYSNRHIDLDPDGISILNLVHSLGELFTAKH